MNDTCGPNGHEDFVDDCPDCQRLRDEWRREANERADEEKKLDDERAARPLPVYPNDECPF